MATLDWRLVSREQNDTVDRQVKVDKSTVVHKCHHGLTSMVMYTLVSGNTV